MPPIQRVQSAAREGRELAGFAVDDACRGHLEQLGLAEHFFHRTGHSIGEEVHGNGANMDNYETHDERLIIPGSLLLQSSRASTCRNSAFAAK